MRVVAEIGIAPPDAALEWGIVVVGLDDVGRIILVSDLSRRTDAAGAFSAVLSTLPELPGQPVLNVAAPYAAEVEAARRAFVACAPVGMPCVAPQDVYTGPRLLAEPLLTLHRGGKLHCAAESLAREIRGYRGDAPRSPRMEAIVAAMARVIACYPSAGQRWGERASAPPTYQTTLDAERSLNTATRFDWTLARKNQGQVI